MISLHVDTKIGAIGWDKFIETHPPYSSALDGYVNVGPRFDSDKMMINFNHHEEVDRLATRSTCAQVLMAIRQGMFSSFRDEHGVKLNIYVNDCDEDVCTSVFLLKHHYFVSNAMNPLINRLVAMEDALDCTAGAYPFPGELPTLQKLAWVFEPYRNFRMNGLLEKKDSNAFKSIITDVEERIMSHVTGSSNFIELDTRYEVIDRYKDLVIVNEIGAHARTGMFSDGIKSFLSFKKINDNRIKFIFGKLSVFIKHDFLSWINRLNSRDSVVAEGNKWGGGNIVFGSPLLTGSALSLNEVIQTISI